MFDVSMSVTARWRNNSLISWCHALFNCNNSARGNADRYYL